MKKKIVVVSCILVTIMDINAQGIITTVAGSGVSGYSGDGGLATSAKLNQPWQIAVDAAENIYIVDANNNRIRKVTASTGIITTIAGNGVAGYNGDGGLATSARINSPTGVAIDAMGNIYISDNGNYVIRKVTVSTGIITTIAGTGTAGFSGDGGLATAAKLNNAWGIALDPSGNLYIADAGNSRIRKITSSTGIITTIAGTGAVGFAGDGGLATSAQFNSAYFLITDISGNIFISDGNNCRIRKITVATGIINTVAGNGTCAYGGDGGAATSASINGPGGPCIDAIGNIYIPDYSNNAIRKVTASTGIITTIAGTGVAGYSGDGGYPTSAQLNAPFCVALDPSGNIYFSERFNHLIRKISVCATFTITPDARFTSSEPGCLGQLENFYSVITQTLAITHSWNFGNGASPATSNQKDPVGIVYSSSGAKLVTHIVSNGTISDTVTNVITINPTPTASFTSTAPVCRDAAVSYTNTGSSGIGYFYSWDLGSDALQVQSTAQHPVGIVYSSSGTKTITQYITNQFGCVTINTQTISINALPVAFAGKDTTICPNTSVQIGSSSVVGNTYSWFPSSSLNNTNSANPVASPVAPVTEYIVTVTNASACKSSDTISVTMLAPLIANAGNDGAICLGDNIQIGAALVNGQNYSWLPVSGLSNSSIANPIAMPSVTTTYTVSVTRVHCMIINDEVTVMVHPLPLVNAGMDDTITNGSTAQLVASGAMQYVWSPAALLDNAGIYNPVASPSITYDLSVKGTDVYGCSNTDTVRITVLEPEAWLPNAFTPGNNGKNDVFYVRGKGIANFEFVIFNRWGEQLFYSKEMTIGWDGTKQTTGEILPEGAYVYNVKGILTNGEKLNLKGLVNLIR